MASTCCGRLSGFGVHIWFWVSLQAGTVQLAAAYLGFNASTTLQADRPVIRLAHLRGGFLGNGPDRFFLKHFDVPNRTLLPDYDIVIDAYSFRPDVGDAVIDFVSFLTPSTPTYHAIFGPMTRKDPLDIVKLTQTANMPHVHGGNNAAFSDRTNYPFSFRVQRSVEGAQRAAYFIAKTNDWRSVISLWAVQELWDSSNSVAESMGMNNYPTLSEPDAASWALDAWQSNLLSFIRSSRVRIILAYIASNQGWQFMCRTYRAQLQGIQLFTDEEWPPAWYLIPVPPTLGDCSGAEMKTAAAGHVTIQHAPCAPGVNLFGAFQFPSIGGDQSQLPLTCLPNLTAHLFFNSMELVGELTMDGYITDVGSALAALPFSGLIAEEMCTIILALHDILYEKNVPLSALAGGDPSAYMKFVDSASKVDFQGPTGHFRFYNNTGDPEYVYHMIRQEGLDDRADGLAHLVGIMTYPSGPENDPVVLILDEEKLPLVWRDGSKGLGPKPELGLFPDCAEVNAVLVWDSCQPCSPGKFYDALLEDCRKCPEGQFQNQSGQPRCELVPAGSYVVDVDNATAILPCPAGSECPQVGTILPQPCAQGTYASSVGHSACELCPEGQYQGSSGASACAQCDPGYKCPQVGTVVPHACDQGRFAATSSQSACELCPQGQYQSQLGAAKCTSCETVLSGSITANIASVSQSQCICPEGTFRNYAASYCSVCKEGMHCPEGSDMENLPTESNNISASLSSGPFPEVLQGYMTRFGAPLTVYRCEAESQCPGGPPGSCGHLRNPDTVACGECAKDAYESGEDCVECGDGGSLPLLGVLAAGCLLVSVCTIVINKDLHKTPAASLMIVAVASLLFTSLQSVGVFRTVGVPWQEPVKTFLELTRVLSFDFNIFKVGCVLGSNPVRSFGFRQLLAVGIIPFILFALLFKKYSPKWGKPRTQISVELHNSIGSLYSVFFISIVISAMDPFMCYEHPGDNGESVQSAPSLLCFEGDGHTTMIFLGMVAMLAVPLPFLSLCCYSVAMYPRYIKLRNSSKFLHATRFLFLRYVPERYYFHIFVLLRSMLLCMVPAILRNRPATQVVFICVILCCYATATTTLFPWRTRLCNYLDAVMTQLLIILMLCGALYLEDVPHMGAISVLSGIIIFAILSSTGIAISYAVWQRLTPTAFNFFICHHKAHAAAQARFLKTTLRKHGRSLRVFIDSDNLQELDKLFDVVKCQVKHLVVYLTADTLKRPWCVGEVVTALRSKLPITRLQTPSFLAPSEEESTDPDNYVDSTGCNLSEYGIQWPDVTEMLSALFSSAVRKLDLAQHVAGTLRFEHAVAGLLTQRLDDTKAESLSIVRAGSVIIVTDAESDEANASGGILVDRIGPDVFRTCEEGLFLLCNYEKNTKLALQATRQASVAVVILSRGCLESVMLLSVICEVMIGSASRVISVNTPGFDFPSPNHIEKHCKTYELLDKAYGENAATLVNAFFRRISILLPTHAAQHALDTQSDEIFRRIQDGIENRSSSRTRRGESGHSLQQAPSSREPGLAGAHSLQSISPTDADATKETRPVAPPMVFTWTIDLGD